MPTNTPATPQQTTANPSGSNPTSQQQIVNAVAAIQAAIGATNPNPGILGGIAQTGLKAKKFNTPNEPDLRKMLHALLDACADGESIVLTKFKVDGTIKLRFGYNIGTQVSQKTIKASGIKEVCSNALEQLIKEKTIKVTKP